jgi:hypothetical protein
MFIELGALNFSKPIVVEYCDTNAVSLYKASWGIVPFLPNPGITYQPLTTFKVLL